jgi:hypothetical protein
VRCVKIEAEKPNHTALDCGLDAKGEKLILEIPEYIYIFVQGETFSFDVYPDGWTPSAEQPKGSNIYIQRPCPKPPERSLGYRRVSPPMDPKLQKHPICNPEL